MICLGYTDIEKNQLIQEFCDRHNIRKVFILSPNKYFFDCSFENVEFVKYEDIIMYVFYYRLLQEINHDVLVVVNECLQTRNRNDLTYNCIRNFLNQTDKQIIFNYLPIIESSEDFFILFDFDTRSRWKRETDFALIHESEIYINPVEIKLNKINVPTDDKLKVQYVKTKNDLIDKIGLKDPHTIPRNLYLLSGKEKVKCISPGKLYVGRNNRFKLDKLETYKACTYQGNYTIFEFCHNHIDFCNFIGHSKQTNIDVLVTDLKIDDWYYERYSSWTQEVTATYAKIQQE